MRGRYSAFNIVAGAVAADESGEGGIQPVEPPAQRLQGVALRIFGGEHDGDLSRSAMGIM